MNKRAIFIDILLPHRAIVACSFRELISKIHVAIWTQNVNVYQIALVRSWFLIKDIGPTFILIDCPQNLTTPTASGRFSFLGYHDLPLAQTNRIFLSLSLTEPFNVNNNSDTFPIHQHLLTTLRTIGHQHPHSLQPIQGSSSQHTRSADDYF